MNFDAKIVDYYSFYHPKVNYLLDKTAGLPEKITTFYKPRYIEAINKKYLSIIESEKPDLIIIYNNQFFLPSTLKSIHGKTKIVFILGDNPLYSATSDYNLAILYHADLIISPDSFWTEQLNKLGLSRMVNDFVGFNPHENFSFTPDNATKKTYGSDLVFIGRNYRDGSGYKRTLFYSKFASLDFKIFGNHEWLRWLEFFPELKPNFILKERAFSLQEINKVINCAKIYPVENNPGMFNGIHLRVFECIGSGVLPLPEWSLDLDTAFNKMVPSIKNYHEANEIARYYLDHDLERLELIGKLRKHLTENYLPSHFVSRLKSNLNI